MKRSVATEREVAALLLEEFHSGDHPAIGLVDRVGAVTVASTPAAYLARRPDGRREQSDHRSEGEEEHVFGET